MKKNHLLVVTLCGLMIALLYVFKYYIGIQTPFVRINLAFVIESITGALLGIVPGVLVGAIADILGASLIYGSINLGITFAAVVRGIVYGAILHKKWSFSRLAIAAFLDQFVCGFVITTTSLFLFSGMPANKAYLIGRFGEAAILFAIELVIMSMIGSYLLPHLKKMLYQNQVLTKTKEGEDA